MITEDYVSFETAKLLKENGFPQNPYICNTAYTFKGKLSNNAKSFVHNFVEFNKSGIKPISYTIAPTLQMAMKWLREIHRLHITIFSSSQESWMFRITKQHQNLEDGIYGEDFGTYEDACEAAIKYCLENLI